MKKINNCLLLFLFFLSTAADASRIPEIEQYYIDQVSSLLKTRFPDTPFTVFAQVDTGDRNKEISRKKEIRRGESSTVQLPYLEVEDDSVSVWDRTDVPLGTLVGLLDHVAIKVQIDSSVNDSELKELQANIAKQLKLDANADSIDISRVNFTQDDRLRQNLRLFGSLAVGLLVFFGSLWYLSKFSVKQLVKGLSKPISEIGKSTQEFANSALNLAADMAQPSAIDSKSSSSKLDGNEDNLSHGSNLIEIRKSAIELIQRNQDMFKNPDARFLNFLEQQGSENPAQMGAILAELDPESIKTLYKYGSGDWWFIALASPAPLTPTSIKILSEIDRLRLRWNFEDSHSNTQKNNIEASLIFGRLSETELASVMQDVPLQDAEQVFNLIPRSLALSVAKKIYPGQWAKFLENKKSKAIVKSELIEKLLKRAIETKPLRKEDQIQIFFADLDLVKYLDMAPPRDERDFYMVLPSDSKIRKERTPFYSIFDAPQELKKIIGGEINAKDWAAVLAGCEQSDQRSLIDAFSDRLRFLVKEELENVNLNQIDNHRIRNIRKTIVLSYLRNRSLAKTNSAELKNEAKNQKAA